MHPKCVLIWSKKRNYLGKLSPLYHHFTAKLSNTLNSTVLANGINQSRPNNRNEKSPGSRPSPSLRNHGARPLMSTNAKKTTISQRSIVLDLGLKPVRAVATGKAHGIPRLAFAQGQHLEQLAHFVFHQELGRLHPLCQGLLV